MQKVAERQVAQVLVLKSILMQYKTLTDLDQSIRIIFLESF